MACTSLPIFRPQIDCNGAIVTKLIPGCGCTLTFLCPSSPPCWSRWVFSSWMESSGRTCLNTGREHLQKVSAHSVLLLQRRRGGLKIDLFAFLWSASNDSRGGAVLSQTVHTFAVHQLDGTDQTSAGAPMVLVATGVAEVNVRANEALLVDQKDHDLWKRGRSAKRKQHLLLSDGQMDPHGARTCCGGNCPLFLLSSDPLVQYWAHWR